MARIVRVGCPRFALGGPHSAGDRRSVGHRSRHLPAARRRGRARGGDRHEPRGRPAGRRRGHRRRLRARRALGGLDPRRRRGGRGRPRTDRRARQQRRLRRVGLVHGHRPGAVGPRAGGQPARRDRRDPRGAARHAGAPPRSDRQHRLRGRPGRVERVGDLLGRQGRRDRLHQGDRDRERPLRDHLQRGRARADRDPAADGRAGGLRRPRQAARREHGRRDQPAPPGPARRGGRGDRFLASDDASYITGQALGVSGGLARI